MIGDLITLLVVYIVATVFTLRWLFKSEQKVVPKNSSEARKVSLRILCVVAALYGISVLAKINVLILFLVILFFVGFACYSEIFSFSVLGSAPFVLVISIGYLIMQFVLGWPVKDQLILKHSAKDFKAKKEDKEGLVGKKGVVLSELKPTGDIEVDGKKYSAVSETGFIEKGETVKVVGKSSFDLVVQKDVLGI